MINARCQTNKVQVCIYLGFALLFMMITANIDEAEAMSNAIKGIELTPISISSAEDVQAIRLSQATEEILLFTSAAGKVSTPTNHQIIIGKNVIAPTPVKQNMILTINQLLAVHPAWDINVTTNQSYKFLAEFAGGATNQLVYYDGDSQGVPFTDNYPLNSFSNPRFARGNSEASRTDVSATLDNEKLVVFSNLTNMKNARYLEIGEWDSGVLVHLKQNHAVIAKSLRSGESRHDIMPGIIEFVELDPQFKPKGAVKSPLLDNTVYEYDADVLFVNDKPRYILFAIGKDILLLGIYNSNDNLYSEIIIDGKFDPSDLSKPSILITATHVYIAVIEARLTKNARILIGSLALNDLKSLMSP